MSQGNTRVSKSEVADMIHRCELHGERGLADALTEVLGRMGRNGTMVDSFDSDEPKAYAYARGLKRAGELIGEGVVG